MAVHFNPGHVALSWLRGLDVWMNPRAMLVWTLAPGRFNHARLVKREKPDKRHSLVVGWAWGQSPHLLKFKQLQKHCASHGVERPSGCLPKDTHDNFILLEKCIIQRWNLLNHNLMFLFFLKVIQGNTNFHSVKSRNLNPRISARYVRISPQYWYGWPCLRTEFMGCSADEGNNIWVEDVSWLVLF